MKFLKKTAKMFQTGMHEIIPGNPLQKKIALGSFFQIRQNKYCNMSHWAEEAVFLRPFCTMLSRNWHAVKERKLERRVVLRCKAHVRFLNVSGELYK